MIGAGAWDSEDGSFAIARGVMPESVGEKLPSDLAIGTVPVLPLFPALPSEEPAQFAPTYPIPVPATNPTNNAKPRETAEAFIQSL